MRTVILSSCTLLLLLLSPGARAQEPTEKSVRKVKRLAELQKDAIARLERLLDEIEELAVDLERRGETQKADQLREAMTLVNMKSIPVAVLAASAETGERQMGDLETAMNTMASILEQRPEHSTEVAQIGRRVVEQLGQIVALLSGKDDVAELHRREKALEKARADTGRLARDQRELKRLTRDATAKTGAEIAAEKAQRDLSELERDLNQLDKAAARDLKKLDAAREMLSRLNGLLRRQQALRTETRIRDGQTDTLRPKVNRALAKIDSLKRAAERSERDSAEQDRLDSAEKVIRRLAQRQIRLRKELEQRDALEKAVNALRPGREMDPEEWKQLLETAAQAARAPEAAALRRAANAPNDERARAQARDAAQQTLADAPSRETIARDEKVLARDVERVQADAPQRAVAPLAEAKKATMEAANKLERGEKAIEEAKRAEEKLVEAAVALKQEARARDGAAQREQKAEQRQAAADAAKKLAEQLRKMAESEDARESGLSTNVDEAAAKTKRAAEELRAAAEATKNAKDDRAERKARAAAERLAAAAKDLREAMEEREELMQRQERVAEDLKGLALDTKSADRDTLQKAAKSAAQASKELSRGKFPEAGRQQDQTIEALEQLTQGARRRVADAARERGAELENLQRKTQSAADRARKIAGEMKEGARKARDADARRRLEEAVERTEEAEKALRRSLKRLSEAMPKSAEQDRREAQEQVRDAKRALKGLREQHPKLPENKRDRAEALAKRQEKLEDRVQMLEDGLRKMKEKTGVDRLQEAQSAMRQARQHLEQGEMDEAERAQDRAQKSLEQAERELGEKERRYRQLRQNELLFKLREELKGFRRAAQGFLETLQSVDAKARREGRLTRSLYRSEVKPLAEGCAELRRDITEKAEAIQSEGAVVYTYLLRACTEDLTEVEASLRGRDVGLIPQELLADVVRKFDMTLKGLERDLAERHEQQQQGQQGQQGQGNQNQGGGTPRLVPAAAEVRMVLVLQRALNKDRERFFEKRPDFGSRKASASEKNRLERMYHRQGSLAELFDNLRENLLGQENEDDPFKEGEEEQR